jgi:hypothetical protein
LAHPHSVESRQEHETLPQKNVGLRIAFIFLGIFILLWLPVEEHSLVLLLLISGCVCCLSLLAVLRRLRLSSSGEQVGRMKYPLAGMLAGVAVTLAAIALMAIKTGMHGHGAPDYSPAQVSLVLRLTLVWAGLGLVTGGLAAAWRK